MDLKYLTAILALVVIPIFSRADTRASASYRLVAETLDSAGGGAFISANYTNYAALGSFAGVSTATIPDGPTIIVWHGFIGQLPELTSSGPEPAIEIVEIASNTIVDAANAGTFLGKALVVGPNATLTTTLPLSLAQLTVLGVVTHPRGQLEGVNLLITGALVVAPGGKIDVTARGYAGGHRNANTHVGETYGPGGLGTTDGGSDLGSGGSYGSLGQGPAPNALYGSETAPAELGSGGPGDPRDRDVRGGNGGGRVRIQAASMIIDGDIVANGGGSDRGAGSGGSILLQLVGGSFSGTGSIRAEGGVSSSPNGGGGLGRIAVVGFNTNAFQGTLGRAGTVFVQPAGTGGDLRLDATTLQIAAQATRVYGSFSSGLSPSTIFNAGTLVMTDDTLVVPNRVTLVQDGVVQGSSNLIGSVTVANGGVVTHTRGNTNGLQLHLSRTLTVETGGRIDVNSKGYAGGHRNANTHVGETYGPGGLGTTDGGSDLGSGGSYGSLGQGPAPNSLYGSETAPAELGSGGPGDPRDRDVRGGNGGGRVRIQAASMIIDGDILANGGGSDRGAGSGGSVFFQLAGGSFSGTGSIRAEGGVSSSLNGGGGLGRIAVVGFSTNAFQGTLGRAGTVFVQRAGTGGDLRLDATTIRIASNETRVFASFSSGASPSVIINSGTLIMTDDALVVPNLVTLVQDGLVQSPQANIIGSVTVANGGVITHSRGNTNGLQLRLAGELTVDAGGKIDVSAKGYRGGWQSGHSHQGETYSAGGIGVPWADGNSGGSYGTLGQGPITNPLYGSETAPVELGSGGAGDRGDPNVRGGNGGGHIRIQAASVTINGEVLSNGGAASTGGGSGGSVFLELIGGNLAGTGSIRVDGGTSPANRGGGGRIAVVGFSQNTFSGVLGGQGTLITTPKTPAALVIQRAPSALSVQFLGSSGQSIVIEASTDLSTWTPVATNHLPEAHYLTTDPAHFQFRFYRARIK
jgi:hypothetical protein